jgi:ferric-dicitrate binding protein FerR (iron transport regulator)
MNEKEQHNFWELIVGKLLSENDKEEEKKLEAFLREEENQNHFRQASNIHQKLYKTKPLRDISSAHSWERVTHYLHREKIRVLITVTKYAAVVLLALFIGTQLDPGEGGRDKTPLFAEISVPLGQMSNITLYDGTQVWLNSGTTLKYAKDFGENSRKVVLNGEAFFKVKPDKIPFKVQLKNSEIEVLGTSFNAISFHDEDYCQVTLVEGLVKMNTLAGKEIARMEPSQQMTLSSDLKEISLKTVDTGFYQSWTDGKIVFHEERLADITFRLERWYNVDIVLGNTEIGEMRFSGTILKNKPFDQIAKAFELLLPVKVDYQNNLGKKDVVTISKR